MQKVNNNFVCRIESNDKNDHNPLFATVYKTECGQYLVKIHDITLGGISSAVEISLFNDFQTAEAWVRTRLGVDATAITEIRPGAIQPFNYMHTTTPETAEEVGKKFDQGKIKAGMVLQYFPRAVLAMAEVGTFGCEKYGDKKDFWDYNWTEVVHAMKRYEDAHARHTLKGYIQERDEETGFLHLAHRAWCAMATLELKLRELEEQDNNG